VSPISFNPRLPPENNVSATHPLVELATLLGGILLATVLLTAGATLALDWLVPHLPASLEQRIFARLWSAPETAAPGAGARDAEQAAAQVLLLRLASHWPDNPYQLRLAVVEDEGVNAFAVPGGLVLATRGLLERASSENELAFVLAHELGHFHGRHQLRALGRGLVLGLTLQALAGASASGLPALAAQMTELRFAREQEQEADRFGLALVEAEYGHVAGATSFFRHLQEARRESPGGPAVAWLSSHPLDGTRIRALETLAQEQGWPKTGPLTPVPWSEPGSHNKATSRTTP